HRRLDHCHRRSRGHQRHDRLDRRPRRRHRPWHPGHLRGVPRRLVIPRGPRRRPRPWWATVVPGHRRPLTQRPQGVRLMPGLAIVPEPHGYAALIADVIGTDDPATLALVEELMRTDTGGPLDALHPAAFRDAIAVALADAATMAYAGQL